MAWNLGRVLGLLFLGQLATQAAGNGLLTTNLNKLGHFWSAIESSNRPVTVVSFGDSMADSYRSIPFHLMNRLRSNFGTAGFSLNNYGNNAMYRLENGATLLYADQIWFSYYFAVPPASAVYWDSQANPGGVYCNSAGIFYVSHPNGGTFTLSVSTNAGPWATKVTLNGYSPTPVGHFTNLNLAPNYHRLRVDTITGTNYIIGNSCVSTQGGGIHAVFMDLGGVALATVTNVPLSIRAPIFAALKPDLLVWHMKEPLEPLEACLRECEQWWSNSAPSCDVIYIGTPWGAVDQTTTTTLDQNTIVRAVAVDCGRTYADLMNPTTSYPWMLSQGYMDDGTHLSWNGSLFCLNIMWDDLGFYALGLNRRLALQRSGGNLQLQYATSDKARYRLESSTNLIQWNVVATNSLTTTTFTTNLPSINRQIYYRLNLAPP